MKKTTFTDFDKQYYISLTEKCNWNCFYCDFPDKKNIKISPIDYVLGVFDQLNKVTESDAMIEYCLEGGEIGTLDHKYLDQIFSHNLAPTYNISTNGLFMKKGFHERYKDKIHYILYHVKEDFLDDYDFDDYDFDDSIDVLYTVVVTKENLNRLGDFLSYHPNNLFQPHILQPRKEDLNFLNKENFQNLYDIIKDKSNVTVHFKERVQRIITKCEDHTWLDSKRLLCSNVYTQPIFDLPNKKINRCCISITGDSVELNEVNIAKLYRNEKLFENKIDKVCTDCVANFLWHDFRHKRYFNSVLKIMKSFAK